MLGDLLTLGFWSQMGTVPSQVLRFCYCIWLQSARNSSITGLHTQRAGSICCAPRCNFYFARVDFYNRFGLLDLHFLHHKHLYTKRSVACWMNSPPSPIRCGAVCDVWGAGLRTGGAEGAPSHRTPQPGGRGARTRPGGNVMTNMLISSTWHFSRVR